MRTIEWTGQFKRDYKREAKGKHRATLDIELFPVISLLANDQALDSRYRDHGLVGNWKDQRDNHINPDLILIYRVQEADALQATAPNNELLSLRRQRNNPLFAQHVDDFHGDN